MIETKAAIFREPRAPLSVETIAIAEPGDNDVLVEIKAAGLCHTDLSIIDGAWPWETNSILGHEGAGIVVACGPAVKRFEPGDHVLLFSGPRCGRCGFCASGRTNYCVDTAANMGPVPSNFIVDGRRATALLGLGTFAGHVSVDAELLVKLPQALAFDIACFIACGGATGLGAILKAARVEAGATVAVFGLGGVGLNAVQGARLAGASQIIAVDTNPAKEEVARSIGATHFLRAAPGVDIAAQIAGITGVGVDYAFECVGSTAVIAQALASTSLAWGKVVIVGVAPAGDTLDLDPMLLVMGRQISGTYIGGMTHSDLPQIADWLVDDTISFDALITHRLPLEAINTGFDLMRNGQSIRTVVTFD